MTWPISLNDCRDPADFMHLACAEWSLGYSQPNRTHVYDGGETDCSALVSWCLRKGMDLPLTEIPWFSTYSELAVLNRHGFRQIRAGTQEPRRNDVLWREGHTALYLGGGKLGQASRDENRSDGWEGSKPGDQDGGETNIAPYLPKSWTLILRNEDLAAQGEAIENGSEEDDVAIIIKPEHTTTQYYFDGHDLHAIGKPSERTAIIKAVKSATGKSLETVYWKQDEFEALQRMLKRSS